MPTYSNTSKHSLRRLLGTNVISDIDAGIAALADDIDAKMAAADAGTLASRPVSTAGTPGTLGRLYRVTDQPGRVDFDGGTEWVALGSPTYVTALPASPADGQEVYYAADSAVGVIWHLRYRAASTSAYKWEYVGGPSLHKRTEETGSTISTTFIPVDGFSPKVTAALAGDYDIDWGFTGTSHNFAQGAILMGVAVGATNPTDDQSIFVDGAGANYRMDAHMTRRITAVAANALLECVYRTTSGAISLRGRWLNARPVRVG